MLAHVPPARPGTLKKFVPRSSSPRRKHLHKRPLVLGGRRLDAGYARDF